MLVPIICIWFYGRKYEWIDIIISEVISELSIYSPMHIFNSFHKLKLLYLNNLGIDYLLSLFYYLSKNKTVSFNNFSVFNDNKSMKCKS